MTRNSKCTSRAEVAADVTRCILQYMQFILQKKFCSCLGHFRVRWVSCHHSIVRPQVADGGDGLQVCRVAANILNKQSRTADKG
jgi:hypothetical protein